MIDSIDIIETETDKLFLKVLILLIKFTGF